MKPVEPIQTVYLFPGLSEELVGMVKRSAPGCARGLMRWMGQRRG
jgi:hypothetical protein